MKRTYSNEPPEIMKLQGQVLVPADIQEETYPDGNIGYSYILCRFNDVAPDLQFHAEKQVIKQKYDESLAKGCVIESLGFRVDCKPENCADFAESLAVWNLAYADQPNAEVVVRDYDNQNHTIFFAEYQVLCQELGAYVMQLRKEKWAAIDALGEG